MRNNFHLTHVLENIVKMVIVLGKKFEREKLYTIFDVC